MNAKQKAFIDKILDGARAAQNTHGVLTSLTLAQAALESGWGKASIGSNIFGIKATKSWIGAKQLVHTTEYVNGEKISVEAYFRDYGSIDDSIADHAKLLTMPRYKAVIAASDYKEACQAIQKCGYATDPKYADKLISLIETNGLNQWDRGTPEKEQTKPAASPGKDVKIKVGDIVRIKIDAAFYATGQRIGTSYKLKRYTVLQVKPDRVLLKEIFSWCKIGDVYKA